MAWETISTAGDSWRPDPGDTLEGEVLKTGEGISQYGEFPYIVVLDIASDEEVLVNGFGAVLMKSLPQVRVGDRVRLIYHGMQAGSGGRSYKSFQVDVDRNGVPVDPTE